MSQRSAIGYVVQGVLLTALGLGCWPGFPRTVRAQPLSVLEQVARGLPHSTRRTTRREAEQRFGWVLPTPAMPDVADFMRRVRDARIGDGGGAHLRLSLWPCPAALRHIVRDPADVVSVIGAIDLRMAGQPVELYLGLGVGAGSSYRAPTMTVNGQSGIAARMAIGFNMPLSTNLTVGAGVNAVGLFRAQRDVWETLAEDRELRGSTILPVHATLRLLI